MTVVRVVSVVSDGRNVQKSTISYTTASRVHSIGLKTINSIWWIYLEKHTEILAATYRNQVAKTSNRKQNNDICIDYLTLCSRNGYLSAPDVKVVFYRLPSTDETNTSVSISTVMAWVRIRLRRVLNQSIKIYFSRNEKQLQYNKC